MMGMRTGIKEYGFELSKDPDATDIRILRNKMEGMDKKELAAMFWNIMGCLAAEKRKGTQNENIVIGMIHCIVPEHCDMTVSNKGDAS